MSSSSNQLLQSVSALNETQLTKLNQAISDLDKTQLVWVSGYLFGLAQQAGATAPLPVPQAQASKTLTILYGSQTGNSEYLAKDHKKILEPQGYPLRITNMLDYKPKDLKKETHVLFIVSTHGEGDAPDDALELWEFLGSKKAPKLEHLNYAVLALGDSSYEFFCQTGKDFDERLAALGAKRMQPRLDCDVDYEDSANAFIKTITDDLKEELTADSQVVPLPGIDFTASSASTLEYNKANPFPATLLSAVKITGRDSVKDIRHIEISLEESGLNYKPGDALGVWFDNDEKLVDEILSITKIDPDEEIELKSDLMSVKQALVEKLELTLSYPGFVRAYAAVSNNEELQVLAGDRNKMREYLAVRQIIDVIRDYPFDISAQELIAALRPLHQDCIPLRRAKMSVKTRCI